MSEAERLIDGDDFLMTPYFSDSKKPCRAGYKGKETYRCTSCGQYKPKRDYYTDNRVPCGIRSKCKACYHKKREAHHET